MLKHGGPAGDDGSTDPLRPGWGGGLRPIPTGRTGRTGVLSSTSKPAHGTCCPRRGAMPRLSPPQLGSHPCTRAHVPRGCVPAAALASGRRAHSQGRKAGSAPSPSKSNFTAACFLLLPRRLRKSFCLRCSSTSAVRTGKIPPCSQEHHWQVSQFFPASAEKKKKQKTSSRAQGGTQDEKRDAWPRAHRCL